MVEELAVGLRLRVVELVDDNDVVGVGRDVVDAVRRQGLDGRKDVLPALWSLPSDVKLAEVAIGKDLAISAHRLLEDLSAMCHE